MTIRSFHFGKKNEKLATGFLKRGGFRILEKNFRTPGGEVDIIAVEGDVFVFVEVKARRSSRYGHPKWAITPSKQRHLSAAAIAYLKRVGKTGSRARFDVITIQYADDRPHIEHIRNAFEFAI